MRLKASDENSSQLSKKEKEILEYIIDRAESGVPPSVREICAALGYKSTSTAHKYLTLLEEKGYLEKQSGKNRSIKLRGEGFVQVPLLGTVAAGQPILAMEQIEDYIPIKTNYSSKDLFALRVQGDSMINVGIYEGDTVILRQTPYAENGQIVAALIEEEATLKTFYRENGHFRLQPENDAMEPFIFDEVTILGVLVALYRRYD